MNNKGFAITATIYGFLVLFLIILLSILAILRSENNRSIVVSERVEANTFLKNEKIVDEPSNVTSFEALQRGKYYFDTNNATDCYVYLPEGVTLSVSSGILKIDGSNAIIFGTDCNNSGISGFSITKYYVAGLEE